MHLQFRTTVVRRQGDYLRRNLSHYPSGIGKSGRSQAVKSTDLATSPALSTHTNGNRLSDSIITVRCVVCPGIFRDTGSSLTPSSRDKIGFTMTESFSPRSTVQNDRSDI